MNRLASMLILLAPALVFAAGEPVVRVKIEGRQPFSVGQQVTVNVQVLVPNFFMSAPKWPAFEVPGTVVTLLDGSAVNLTETIAGESYAGIQRAYLIVPQQEGRFTLPPAEIPFDYAAIPGQATAAVVTLPPEAFTATAAAGVEVPGVPVPVVKVSITQTLDRDTKGLRVGDTITRTVEAFAENTQAMMIPPPTFAAPAGVRIYTRDPVLNDETDGRGGFLGGRRTDRATYAFQEAGAYTLPAVEIKWLDPVTGKEETTAAPEIKVVVAANPASNPEIAPEAPESTLLQAVRWRVDWQRRLVWALGSLSAVFLIASLVRHYAPRYRAWSATRRHVREESERAYFARVVRACTINDAHGAYRCLGAWTRRVAATSITDWCACAGDAELRNEIHTLERFLFALGNSSANWSGESLARRLAASREQWLRQQARGPTGPAALPALNP